MLIGTLKTRLIEKHEQGVPAEGGQFEMPVRVDKTRMTLSGDPKQFMFREIGFHLAQAVLDSTVPKEFWFIELEKPIQEAFNLPATVPFG